MSILALSGYPTSLIFAVLWFLYLSIFQVGQAFSAFQWDILLLEAGFLVLFYAPTFTVTRYGKNEPPSPVIRWLLQWLFFRLLFASGILLTFKTVKINKS